MGPHLLACDLLLMPGQALAGARETLAALAPSGLVLVIDEMGNELVAQNRLVAGMSELVTAAG